jgi:small GTP-binding protein
VIKTMEGPLAALREAEIKLLTDIGTTLGEMGEGAQEDRRRLIDVAQDLRNAFFLVVIIGEFNAGKSSFVNALLGDELLPMGITPTTEAIELIRYNETVNRKPTMREDGIREWSHPNTGAVGVALVDTPGTGSVFQKHEKTAKSFLHRSDLVIFVISAKRALAQTEKLYLELARDFGKKVILVVNQVDLLQPQEQNEVRRFVERQVEELLNLKPLLFMVSARDALNAKRSGTTTGDPGGIGAVKAHLRGVFEEAPPAKQKLISQLDLAEHLIHRYLDNVKSNADLVNVDTTKVRDVQSELERQALGLDAQLKGARGEVDRVFDGLRQRGQQFISANMSVKQIGRAMNRDAFRDSLQAEFNQVVIGRALRDINEATSDYINAVVDHSRLYWRGVIDRLNQLRDLMEQELTGLDSGVYAEQRESLEEAIRIAEGELQTYSSGRVLGDLQTAFESNMGGLMTSFVAAVGGLLVLAAAAAAPGPLVGAAALAAAAALPFMLGGGFLAYRYYRHVTDDARRDLNARIDQLQKTYHDALDSLTQKERSRLTQYGQQVLTPVFSRLEVLNQRYAEQQATLRKHLDQLAALRREIDASK